MARKSSPYAAFVPVPFTKKEFAEVQAMIPEEPELSQFIRKLTVEVVRGFAASRNLVAKGARTKRWKLSPAANCPGLPVNGKRNEG